MAATPNAEDIKILASGIKTFIDGIENFFVATGTKMKFKTPNGRDAEIYCTAMTGDATYFERTVSLGKRTVRGKYCYSKRGQQLNRLDIVEDSPQGTISQRDKSIRLKPVGNSKGGEFLYQGTTANPLCSISSDKSILRTPEQTKSMINYVRTGKWL